MLALVVGAFGARAMSCVLIRVVTPMEWNSGLLGCLVLYCGASLYRGEFEICTTVWRK